MEKYRIGIETDDCPENPLDYSEYELISFSTRHTNFGNPEELGWFKGGPYPTPKLKKLMEQDLAFILHYYEHGQCSWQLQDAPHIPGSDCPWDSVSCAGLLIWKDDIADAPAKERRVEYAKGQVETYTDWVNGSVYSWFIENKRGDTIESLSGCFGLEYTEQSLTEALSALPQRKLRLSERNQYLDGVPTNVWQPRGGSLMGDLSDRMSGAMGGGTDQSSDGRRRSSGLTLTDRESSHILAGLRMLQEACRVGRGTIDLRRMFDAADLATDGDTHEHMTVKEIDELIDKIN